MFRTGSTYARLFRVAAMKMRTNGVRGWTIEGAVASLREFGRKTAGMAEVHEAAKPLSWLLGQWESVEAKGMYPTSEPFTYTETLNITHVGQPVLNFSSETWQASDPKHIECGFIRMKPGSNQVAYICAQNIGMVEIEEGELDGTSVEFHTSSILRMTFAKETGATGLKRTFRLNSDDILEQIVYMSTQKTPMTKHLHVKYKKKEASNE